MDRREIDRVLRAQKGVIGRRQVLANDGTDADIARMIRRREWAPVHDGVYVNHTGPLTWEQRAWAALLFAWPAALGGRAAVRAHGLSGPSRCADGDVIDVVITCDRRVRPPDGVRVRRITDYAGRVQENKRPPRVRIEYALLVLASRARTDDAAVAVLADGCQSGATTAERLLAALKGITRLGRRSLMLEILRDVAAGAFSALERRYLKDVDRAHGLPPSRRQKRVDGLTGVVYRDVEYEEQQVIVELDGRLGHEWNSDRWDDLDRDVASAEDGALTIRLGWKQVLDRCRLAVAVARILRARGWTGAPSPCGPGCPINSGKDPAPRAGSFPPSQAA